MDVKTFQDLQRRVHHLLLKGFETERDPLNTQMLLGALTVYLAEQAPLHDNLAVQALRSMLRVLCAGRRNSSFGYGNSCAC